MENGNEDLKYQWTMETNEGQFMMLNTDMEVIYDIDVDNFKNGTKCTIVDQAKTPKCCMENSRPKVCPNNMKREIVCTKASTANLVALYAKVRCKGRLNFKT